MTESVGDTDEGVTDDDGNGFKDAVREAVRPFLYGLAALIGVVTLAGAIAITALVVQANDNAKTRTEGQTRTCGSDQYFEIHHNALVQANQEIWNKALADSAATKPPAERPFIAAYAKGINDRLELTKVDVRGCSDADVQAYIKWRTEHPTAVKCETDAHGYCKVPPTETP